MFCVLTSSMPSPSAAAFLFSLALTLAVVDNTAVATFVNVSFLGGLVDDGIGEEARLRVRNIIKLGSL